MEGGCEEEAVADVVDGGPYVLLAAAAPEGGERPDVLCVCATGDSTGHAGMSKKLNLNLSSGTKNWDPGGRTYIVVFAVGHEVCRVAAHLAPTRRHAMGVPFPQGLVELFAGNA